METKKLNWRTLAMMGFTVVWGFGNVVNNYANQGLTVVISWLLILTFYFLPYALMVGEMGSVFENKGGGVSSWIGSTYGPMIAYLAGWTYWVVHIPYLAQKPQGALVALSWVFFQNGDVIKSFNPLILQSIVLAIFLFFLWLSSKGINSLKKIGALAGTSMFFMGILYILLTVAAPSIVGANSATTDWSLNTFLPKFDFAYFTTLSMLVFAVGGCEKISPYVKEVDNPNKNFPKGMIILAASVGVSALLGSLAMGIMFNSGNIPADLKMNGQYYAFKLLGEYYGLGNTLMVLYAIANTLGQISALMFSIDAPLKMLIGEGDRNFIPQSFTKTNEYGAPINGYKLTAILVGILIIIPALGIGDMNNLYNWLLDLNSIVMPLRYLWVFLAYIGLRGFIKNKGLMEKATFKFIASDKAATLVGIWCFLFTAFACLMGIFPKNVETLSSEWIFQISLNILTPIVLIGLGFILPRIAKKQNL
ncbi:Inner membrane transporter ycaM [Fusobacterium necrogenes]|uniref:Inner membrane transporter ycaM n=1 Tax=Fusobacterium necrogenes TaxID=858 RepID=A0A377GW07_9FUSO|nr:amino acid permease [Fusobacterium necrogenes]STO30804.1 Inner membrane transporter ycaM [Fusobacterium necrogenes]